MSQGTEPVMSDTKPTLRRGVNTTAQFEVGAVTSLFPRVAATTILLLVVLVSIRGSTGSKGWDRAAFVASVAVAVLLSLHFLRRPKVTPNRLALVVGVGGIL